MAAQVLFFQCFFQKKTRTLMPLSSFYWQKQNVLSAKEGALATAMEVALKN